MLETYGFFAIVAGIVLLVVGFLWFLVRAFRERLSGRWAVALFPPSLPIVAAKHYSAMRGPVRLLILATLLIAVPYGASYYERHFVPLQPFEQRVDGELRITLTGLRDFDYATLAARPEVVVLQMANADVVDGTLEHLRGLKRLRKLDLADTQITDAGLAVVAELPALAELYLNRTRITDTGFQKHLAEKESLRKVDFTATEVRGKTKRDWKNRMPNEREYVD